MSGPISVDSSSGSPTFIPRVAVTSSSANRSYALCSIRMRERAQQSWPALSKTAYGAVAAAFSRSASAKTTFADLPPSSSVTRLIVDAALRITICPTSVEPVNPIFATSGCSISRCPTTEPLPTTTFSTPSGIPASRASSPRRIVESGVSSAGLITIVLPQASAGPIFHDAMLRGKFHGVIRPTTPSGSRKVMSTPPPTGIVSP